jgi:hypothetical protein
MLEPEPDFEFDQLVSLATAIQPIMALRHLENLKLEFIKSRFYISDDDVSAVAISCPSLKVLSLGPMPEEWPVEIIRPTLLSLRRLATTCLDLIDLELPISVDAQTLSSDMPIISSHGLQSLHLCDSSIYPSLLLQLARQIDQLFPHLKTLVHDKEDFPRLCDLVVDLCQPVRRDERQRDADLALRRS